MPRTVTLEDPSDWRVICRRWNRGFLQVYEVLTAVQEIDCRSRLDLDDKKEMKSRQLFNKCFGGEK